MEEIKTEKTGDAKWSAAWRARQKAKREAEIADYLATIATLQSRVAELEGMLSGEHYQPVYPPDALQGMVKAPEMGTFSTEYRSGFLP